MKIKNIINLILIIVELLLLISVIVTGMLLPLSIETFTLMFIELILFWVAWWINRLYN